MKILLLISLLPLSVFAQSKKVLLHLRNPKIHDAYFRTVENPDNKNQFFLEKCTLRSACEPLTKIRQPIDKSLQSKLVKSGPRYFDIFEFNLNGRPRPRNSPIYTTATIEEIEQNFNDIVSKIADDAALEKAQAKDKRAPSLGGPKIPSPTGQPEATK